MQFTLGLNTGMFVNNLAGAGNALKGFVGSLVSVGAISEGVWSAIEKGAGLDVLSRRTSTAVSDLYQLQKGFQAADVDVDSLGATLFQMQKALGGVSESGEDTKSIFARMGLSVDDLKKQNAPEQINAILKSLDSLGTSEAAKAASSIFGRMNAQNILQLTNSTEEFGAAIKAATNDGQKWERLAPMFDHIEKSLKKTKAIGMNFFAGIAEGAAPAIDLFLNKINGIDLTSFGHRLGHEFAMVFESIKLDKFGQYFTLTLQAGVQEMSNGMMKKINEWYLAMNSDRDKAGNPTGGLKKTGAVVAGVGEGLLGIWDSIGGIFSDNLNKLAIKRFTQAQSNFDFAGIGEGLITKLADPIARGMLGQSNPYLEALTKLRSELSAAADADAPKASDKKYKPFGLGIDKPENHYKADFTAFEKMGFVMGGSNSLQETSRQTADHTRGILAEIRAIRSGHGMAGLSPWTDSIGSPFLYHV